MIHNRPFLFQLKGSAMEAIMDKTDVRSERVTILFSPFERRTLEALASEEMRTMSQLIRKLVWDEARKSGIVQQNQRKARDG